MPTDSLVALIAYEVGVWAIVGAISRIIRYGMRATDRRMRGVIIPNVSAFLVVGTVMAYGGDSGTPEWLVGLGGSVVPAALWVWYDAFKLKGPATGGPSRDEPSSTP